LFAEDADSDSSFSDDDVSDGTTGLAQVEGKKTKA
jgi:hypothetical protein